MQPAEDLSGRDARISRQLMPTSVWESWLRSTDPLATITRAKRSHPGRSLVANGVLPALCHLTHIAL